MPFTPGSPSSLPTHIKADIHIQPSKTSVSASAQGQRAAGDERGFRTPTSASARRSGRPSRHSPARRARLFLGRQVGGEAGGVKFLQPIKGRSIGILYPPYFIRSSPLLEQELFSFSMLLLQDSSTALAGSSFLLFAHPPSTRQKIKFGNVEQLDTVSI